MAGLLRAALRAGLASGPRVQMPASLARANEASIPFVPVDWVFRFFPYFSRDKVRFMFRFNQISFGCGLGYFYLWCHTPYKCDNYDHFDESMLYKYVKGNMEKTGQLEENLRVKVRHFYPQTEDA
eukprot:TRINITY_DN27927_c0_g1_i1.p1 TRINITY_DN27927_c0_g1~~TRINITY_DN27927_c0_g1_i1.p1  ORF type:complete len:144 (+),score=15.13 TRINITY_DN27927_c0_g1_i1:59-433(+)